jgi:hypothetical protein
MSFETNIGIETQEHQKQKLEKKETNQEKKERLVIFEIKNKISPTVIKNKIKELDYLKNEIEELKSL